MGTGRSSTSVRLAGVPPVDGPLSIQEQLYPELTCFGCGHGNPTGLRLRPVPPADAAGRGDRAACQDHLRGREGVHVSGGDRLGGQAAGDRARALEALAAAHSDRYARMIRDDFPEIGQPTIPRSDADDDPVVGR